MFKHLLIASFVIIGLTIPTIALAKDKFSILTFNDMNTKKQIIAHMGKDKVSFTIDNCTVFWKPSDQFYFVTLSGGESFVVKKITYDKLISKYHNEEQISKELIKSEAICTVASFAIDATK